MSAGWGEGSPPPPLSQLPKFASRAFVRDFSLKMRRKKFFRQSEEGKVPVAGKFTSKEQHWVMGIVERKAAYRRKCGAV
jgi:hypothetical protein